MTHVPLSELTYFVRNVLAAIHLQTKTNGLTGRATVVALVGEVGAGKTTLQSPTYVLMKSYPISFDHFQKLIHIDAYRLESPEQFASLDPDSFLHDPTVLVCIEWPERVVGKLPTPDMVVTFTSEGMKENERTITFV
jgi:tRNA threonylcarbamoyladenosine biosynthesis protein TsaE